MKDHDSILEHDALAQMRAEEATMTLGEVIDRGSAWKAARQHAQRAEAAWRSLEELRYTDEPVFREVCRVLAVTPLPIRDGILEAEIVTRVVAEAQEKIHPKPPAPDLGLGYCDNGHPGCHRTLCSGQGD